MNPLDRLLTEAQTASEHDAAELRALLAGTHADQREAFRAGLTDRQRTALGRYGYRSAIVALRERSAGRLRIGLIAVALEDTNIDPRDLMVGVAMHHHVARELGLAPAEVFDEAASYAAADTAKVLREFGRRTDVTLEVFGWRQIDTPDGPDITHR